ncbi:unnamed protein product [Phytomonas sp. Hart1]|nr:unnamed protein product [Phytomonas sp. Hart1]|eukprot:CCW66263.1 unnamed protein product [Phytomonas sp. isolate Hart1]
MLRLSKASLKAIVLSSSGISSRIRQHVALEVSKLSRPPHLAVLLVGSRPDSLSYIHHKKKAAKECGIHFELIHLSESISQAALHQELSEVGNNPAIDGVLLQLPLPKHLHVTSSLFHIHPNKDVDGLHLINSGNLFLRDRVSLTDFLGSQFSEQIMDDSLLEDTITSTGCGCFVPLTRRSHEDNYFVPCTALSVRSILLFYLYKEKKISPFVSGTPMCNLHVVIVSKSMVVGIPTAALLQKEGFIVSICDRNNSLDDIQRIMKTGDIVITAYGQAEIFDADFFKKGAVIIDVGINELLDEKNGNVNLLSTRRKICGDVNLKSVLEVASAISPTPGGVGPLTVAYLMQNILKASCLRDRDGVFMNNIYSSFLKMYETDDTSNPNITLLSPHQSLMEINRQGENVDNSNFEF